MFAYTLIWCNYFETLAKTFLILARINRFIQEDVLINAPVCQNAISMNTRSAFSGPYAANPFWYQQIDVRQIKTFRISQTILDFFAADICRLCVTTMKAIHFQEVYPRFFLDEFKDNYVLVFDCHLTELVEEPQKLEHNFTYPLENVT